MTRSPLMILGLVAALGLGTVVVVRSRSGSTAERSAATYYCPMHPTYTSDKPGDCPICNMRLVKREPEAAAELAAPQRGSGEPQPATQATTYSCPMHPDVTSTAPGECPVCHMRLVPKEPPPEAAMQGATAHDVCYLHNCPMEKEGKPCPMLVVAKPGEAVTCPVCGTHIADASGALRKVLYWTDPMIPDLRSEVPGTSPMGMDLVPVFAEAHAGHGAAAPAVPATPEGYAAVLLTPQKQQFIGVTTAEARVRDITKTIRTVGRVAYDPELYQAQQEYLQSLKSLQQAEASGLQGVVDQAKRLVDSSKVRLRLLGLNEEMIRGMADWQAPDQRLLLADPSGQAWVYAAVYEYELSLVNRGLHARIQSAGLPGRTFEGEVKAVDPVLDPATRTARARILVDNAAGQLRPEMYVDVFLVARLGQQLAVPVEAVFDTGTKQIVFVDKGQGLFEPRDVAVGVKADGFAEIRSGLAEGDRVVTSGNFLIDSESRLKAALEGMGPSTGSASGGGHQHGQ